MILLKLENNHSYESSLAYIKQLTTIVVSCVTYMNEALPRSSFIEETFETSKIWVLKKTCDDEITQFLNKALDGAFDALNKQYLHKLAICFYKDDCDPDNMIESHIIEYNYKKDFVSMKMHLTNKDGSAEMSFDAISQQTINFLQSVHLWMGLNSVPLDFGLSVRLYHVADSDMPADYVEPGYLCQEGEDHLKIVALNGEDVTQFETIFHKLSMVSYYKDQPFQSILADPSKSPTRVSNTSKDLGRNEKPRDEMPRYFAEVSAPQNVKPTTEDPKRVWCPCLKFHDVSRYRRDELLTCFYCSTVSHAECYGVYDDATQLSRHCCVNCRDPTRLATDITIEEMQDIKRKRVCDIRRALKLCRQLGAVSALVLEDRIHVKPAFAIKIMQYLYKNGIIQHDPETRKTEAQNVKEETLKQLIVKHTNKREKILVDRLSEEVLSQESNTNVFESYLSPSEKRDICDSSNLTRPMDPTENASNSFIEDSVFKEYKQGLIEEVIQDPLPKVCDRIKDAIKRKPAMTSDVGNKKSRLHLKRK